MYWEDVKKQLERLAEIYELPERVTARCNELFTELRKHILKHRPDSVAGAIVYTACLMEEHPISYRSLRARANLNTKVLKKVQKLLGVRVRESIEGNIKGFIKEFNLSDKEMSEATELAKKISRIITSPIIIAAISLHIVSNISLEEFAKFGISKDTLKRAHRTLKSHPNILTLDVS